MANVARPKTPNGPPHTLPKIERRKSTEKLLDLADLQKLVNVKDVQAQFHLLLAEETQTDQRLDNIMKGRAELENQIKVLDEIRPQISSLRHDASFLLTVLTETSSLAERISGKVRQLDSEQSRVKATITLVEDIQELKKCAAGAEKAIAIQDYELVGHYISRYLSYDPVVVEKIFSSNAMDDMYLETDTTLQPSVTPLEALKATQQKLVNIAMDEFDTAAQQGDDENILRFFKLFPMTGHHELGLDKFSAYICGSISRQCQDNMRGSMDAPQFYANLLTNLFERIALEIDRQEPMISATYGPGTMLRVIQRLQREADIQSSIILNSLKERRQISRKLVDISQLDENNRRSSAQGQSPQPSENPVDLREVDSLLNEITLISQKAALFNRFLHIRAAAEIAKLRESPPKGSDWKTPLDGDGDGLVNVSKLDELTQELMGDYVSLEEYFIRRNIEKAMSIDSHEQGELISSCVEDVFFVLKTCTRRALATSDSDGTCAIINGIGRILELDFISIFQKQLGIAFSGTENAKDTKESAKFMVTLNNIDVSCEYVVKLTEELERDVAQIFGSRGDLSLEKIRSCLGVLSEYAGSFRNILKTWIDNLFKQQIKPRLRPLLQLAYHDVKYTLNSNEYAAQERDDLLAKRFNAGLSKVIAPYQKNYTEWNYNQTALFMIDYVTKDWERYLYQSQKFTQFGALRFDRDLRAVSSYLSSVTQWSCRDKFTRLNQISTLLNLENLDELADMWGKSGPVAWRLTPKDVRRILALRVDFNVEAINRLEL
ncbi:COG4 transport protein-domain-containing protein [Phlyctochytrium arcticum]|nr:COG4 transport protein-domain-containing protein [Phlyctochytrium arcticum]